MNIWDNLDNLNEDELRTLVKATVKTLLDSDLAVNQFADDFIEISPVFASKEIISFAKDIDNNIDENKILTLLRNDNENHKLCLNILKEISNIPELSNQISLCYENMINKMAITESILLTGALVILATKLKSFKVSKSGIEVNLYDFNAKVLSIFNFFNKNI